MILGIGAVDLFIDDGNPLNKAVHSSLGIILAYNNVRLDNILLKNVNIAFCNALTFPEMSVRILRRNCEKETGTKTI